MVDICIIDLLSEILFAIVITCRGFCIAMYIQGFVFVTNCNGVCVLPQGSRAGVRACSAPCIATATSTAAPLTTVSMGRRR